MEGREHELRVQMMMNPERFSPEIFGLVEIVNKHAETTMSAWSPSEKIMKHVKENNSKEELIEIAKASIGAESANDMADEELVMVGT